MHAIVLNLDHVKFNTNIARSNSYFLQLYGNEYALLTHEAYNEKMHYT